MMRAGGRKRGRGMRLHGGGGQCGGVGRAKTSAIGRAGLKSNILALLGNVIFARRTTGLPHTGRIQGIGIPKDATLETASQAREAHTTGQQDRQTRNVRFKAFIDVRKCMGCGICEQVCPSGAIIVNNVALISYERCTGCGRCVAECPQDALTLRKMSWSAEKLQPERKRRNDHGSQY